MSEKATVSLQKVKQRNLLEAEGEQKVGKSEYQKDISQEPTVLTQAIQRSPSQKLTVPIQAIKARSLASPEHVLPPLPTTPRLRPDQIITYENAMKQIEGTEPDERYLRKIMSVEQRFVYILLLILWFCTFIFFAVWWLQPEHTVTLGGTIINSLLLLWPGAMTAYYFLFVTHAYQPDSTLPFPEGHVAMVVTKAPMEPWSVVKKTLLAMKEQVFPRDFDIWLADEDPSEETIIWCQENGVLVLSRKGIPDYHNTSWPRRQRSKEGNLAFFYDTCGYSWYDFVVQMDADHVPEKDYLMHMIEPFRDPAIGYVAAPSICDANADRSWAARARLYVEASLHGPLQAGYAHRFAPLCIGSHYAVRTRALQEIGGLGPELAEDHSTSLLFNSHDWHGVFALEAIAHGDGPECLADCLTQEFQWSRSLMKLLLTLLPKRWKGLAGRLKGQFLFAQLWYPLSTCYMLVATLCPVIALTTRTPLANVNYPDFLWHFSTIAVSTLLVVAWIKKQGWLRPANARIISWEASIFQFVRWPWILLGVLQATVSVLLRREFTFRVTPKGSARIRPLPGRVLFPYTCIVGLMCICALLFKGGPSHTYQYFITLSMLTYTLILWICIFTHARENRAYGRREIWRTIRGPLLQALCASVCCSLDIWFRLSDILSPFLN